MNLLKASYHADENGLYQRHFYEYDENGLAISHLVDDGTALEKDNLTRVTERKIERTKRSTTYPFGLPIEVSELYFDCQTSEEKLMRKQKNTHDLQGRLVHQSTFDADDRFAFEEKWSYDSHGNLLSHINPIGDITAYQYDSNDNKIYEEKPNGVKIYSFYDYMNRLIKVEEHHEDSIRVKQFSYDLCGNKIKEVDPFGHETSWEYDDFNRPIKITFPEIPDKNGNLYSPSISHTYDELSHVTSTVDPEGHTTEWKYTLHGKPYLIRYPNGAFEKREYNKRGCLIKETAKNGTATVYTLDSHDRVIEKQIFNQSGELLVKTLATYNSFHLLSETDPEGKTTFYTYDGQGRKVSIQKGDRITHFEYDALGRLFKTIEGNTTHLQFYDPLNRVIEEQILAKDILLSKTLYDYDVDGHKIKIEEKSDAGVLITRLQYNTHGIPVSTIDPEGHETKARLVFDHFNSYGQNVYCLETVDPLGQLTCTIQDTLGNVSLQIKKDPYGSLIQKIENLYNSKKKCLQTIHTVLYKGEEKKIKNAFTYDSESHLIEIIEAVGEKEEKRTVINYNRFGEKQKVIKPDGTALLFTYDALGRLHNYSSSTNGFSYSYTYDKNSNPIEVKEAISGTVTKKTYNPYGEIEKELLGNGLSLSMTYTSEGLLETCVLPDFSSIHYSYLGNQLKNVERIRADGSSLKHSYDAYDLSGKLTAMTTCSNEKIHFTYTKKGELQKIDSSPYTQDNCFDPIGNLIERTYRDPVGEIRDQFAYDTLYQLQSESGTVSHLYTHDSLYNRRSKDRRLYQVNALNQLLSDETMNYQYDLVGNLIQAGNRTFTYDSLDRLIGIEEEDVFYKFTYDEQNRCMSIEKESEGVHHYEKLLYNGQNEIGSLDRDDKMLTLRILGKGCGGEIGGAVLLEIQDQVYVPFHDHRGSVIALLTQDGKTIESYRYSAFGEEEIYDPLGEKVNTSINPWRFSSKRKISDYLLFGRRFYQPEVGRWLTPDPLGLDAGPNLYTYVLNNPLTHFDTYGLFGERCSNAWSSVKFSLSQGCSRISQAIHSFTSKGFAAMQATRAFIGNAVSIACKELIPFPLIKDAGMALGHFIKEGSLNNYTPSWKQYGPRLIPNQGNGYYQDRLMSSHTNGFHNSYEDAVSQGQGWSQLFNGSSCNGVYTGDYGLIGNLLTWGFNALGLPTQATRLVMENIRNTLASMQNGGLVDGILSLSGFSNGACINKNATAHLSSIERSHIAFVGMGGAAIARSGDFIAARNYISTRDPIPFIASPMATAEGFFGQASHIEFVKAIGNPFFDHAFDSITYARGRELHKQYLDEKVLRYR